MELALLTPLLLLLIIGTVEMGRYAYIDILVGNAARAGASWGAQNHNTAGDPSGITAAVNNDFQSTANGQSTPLSVSSAYYCECDSGGSFTSLNCSSSCPIASNEVVSLQVTATGKFNSLFKYPGIPSPLTFTSTATQRIGP